MTSKESNMKITPAALDSIIEALEVKFPNKLPTKPDSIESYLVKVGNQQVIEYLREIKASL